MRARFKARHWRIMSDGRLGPIMAHRAFLKNFIVVCVSGYGISVAPGANAAIWLSSQSVMMCATAVWRIRSIAMRDVAHETRSRLLFLIFGSFSGTLMAFLLWFPP